MIDRFVYSAGSNTGPDHQIVHHPIEYVFLDTDIRDNSIPRIPLEYLSEKELCERLRDSP